MEKSTKKTSPPVFTAFAAALPGLGNGLADEIQSLEITPRLVEGGCEFDADFAALYRANLYLRTATRVLMRVAEFHAGHFSELEKRAAALPWRDWLKPGIAVRVEAVSYRSKLYHEKGVAERIQKILAEQLGAQTAPDRESGQLVLVRVVANECTISFDSSGELLHRRGYRQELTKATLRETLAAALVKFSGWDGKTPLLDPFCGSGTIAIEAAMLARNLAPGRNRKFAFMDWPNFDDGLWRKLLLEAGAKAQAACPPIYASDRDAGAIEIAKANAARAGVQDSIVFTCCALKSASVPPGPLCIATNPPYGHRLEGGGDLRNLYAALGNFVRARAGGTKLTFISSNPRWTGNTGLRFELGPRLSNGSIPIRFARMLPTPKPDDKKLLHAAVRERGLGHDDFLFVVDVENQELRVWQSGRNVATHTVSTARRGVGNIERSLMTPPGWHEVDERIGDGKPAGTVFKARVHAGRVVAPKDWSSPFALHDAITSRILWLRGLEDGINRGPGMDTHGRFIYIHGTIHEDKLGTPASAGCVRMANRDIVALFDLCRDRRIMVWIG